jgi:ABC-type multidrug transport system fused ATPase/permease subunit
MTEPTVALDVIRIGDLSSQSEVAFQTADGSALAGDSYVATSGILSFKPGQHKQQIKVKLKDDALWNTALEFRVILKSEDMFGAVLGKYLFETKVKVVDTTTFPSERFAGMKCDDDFGSPGTVLVEFFKMCWGQPEIRRGTLWCRGVDTVHNLLYLVNLFLSVYLLNDVVRVDAKLFLIQDRKVTLMLYGGFTVASVMILHMLDHSKIDTKVMSSIGFLQNGLVRKFLDLKAHVRDEVNEGDVVNALQRDVPTCVTQGYMAVLKLVCLVEKLVCMILFQLLCPHIFGTKLSMMGILPMIVFPVVLGVYLPFRVERIRSTIDKAFDMENVMTDQIDQITDNHLVLDYDRRSVASEGFRLCALSAAKGRKEVAKVFLNTDYFNKWLASLLTGVCVVVGGMGVLNGAISVGMFVTNLKILDAAGDAYEDIFRTITDMQKTYPAIMNLFELLNLESDIQDRMRLAASEEKQSIARENAMLAAKETGEIPEDMVQIEINLYDDFAFERETPSPKKLNFKGDFKVNQGQMVAIVGSVGSGKATLLDLISGRKLLDISRCGGSDNFGVFIPSHLRIINVCMNPIFYSGTLLENITFGSGTSHSSDADTDRAVCICQRIGLQEDVLSYLDQQENWDCTFSEAQRKLVNIARALFFNAEVTCFHSPLAKLDPTSMPLVMDVLSEHIQQRGLALDNDTKHRRPRTIFMTSSNPIAVMEADHIYAVSPENGISLLTQEMARELLNSQFNERGSAHGEREKRLKSPQGDMPSHLNTTASNGRWASGSPYSPVSGKSSASGSMASKRAKRNEALSKIMSSRECSR